MICVDASVAAKWLFPEEYSAQALSLVNHAAAAKERIIAPALLPIEITNIIRQRMRQGTLRWRGKRVPENSCPLSSVVWLEVRCSTAEQGDRGPWERRSLPG